MKLKNALFYKKVGWWRPLKRRRQVNRLRELLVTNKRDGSDE